jgi:hypothetical protein
VQPGVRVVGGEYREYESLGGSGMRRVLGETKQAAGGTTDSQQTEPRREEDTGVCGNSKDEPI